MFTVSRTGLSSFGNLAEVAFELDNMGITGRMAREMGYEASIEKADGYFKAVDAIRARNHKPLVPEDQGVFDQSYQFFQETMGRISPGKILPGVTSALYPDNFNTNKARFFVDPPFREVNVCVRENQVGAGVLQSKDGIGSMVHEISHATGFQRVKFHKYGVTPLQMGWKRLLYNDQGLAAVLGEGLEEAAAVNAERLWHHSVGATETTKSGFIYLGRNLIASLGPVIAEKWSQATSMLYGQESFDIPNVRSQVRFPDGESIPLSYGALVSAFDSLADEAFQDLPEESRVPYLSTLLLSGQLSGSNRELFRALRASFPPETLRFISQVSLQSSTIALFTMFTQARTLPKSEREEVRKLCYEMLDHFFQANYNRGSKTDSN